MSASGGKCFEQLPIIPFNATRFSDNVGHAFHGEKVCEKSDHVHFSWCFRSWSWWFLVPRYQVSYRLQEFRCYNVLYEVVKFDMKVEVKKKMAAMLYICINLVTIPWVSSYEFTIP